MQKLWFCSAGMEAWPDSGTVSDPPGSTLQGHLQDQGNENAITQQVIIEEGASQAHSLREADSGGGQQLKNEADGLTDEKTEVCHPFLLVRGWDKEWNDIMDMEDILKQHFQAEANGAEVASVTIAGTEAQIIFTNPQVALRFTSSTDLLGLTLPLEVVTKAAKGESNMVLGVRLGSTRIPEEILKSALVKHFSRHTGFKAECEIINGIGFLTFDDPEAVKTILSNPPTAKFFMGSLEIFAPSSAGASPPAVPSHSHTTPSLATTRSTPYMSLDPQRAESAQRLASPQFGPHAQYPDPRVSWNEYSQFGMPMYSLPPSAALQRSYSSGITFTAPHQTHFFPSGRAPMVQEMGEPSTPPSIYNCPMNVLVEGVPSAAGDPTTIEYYLSSLTHVKCEVTQHGRSFLAKFQQKIDFEMLKQRSKSEEFRKSCRLSFSSLSPTNMISVDLNESAAITEYLLKLHLERFAGIGTIEDVKFRSSFKAIVTFKDPKSVEAVISNQQCCMLDNHAILIKEYYDFLEEAEEVDTMPSNMPAMTQNEQPPVSSQATPWCVTSTPIDAARSSWLQKTDNLHRLNTRLNVIKAEASIDEDTTKSPLLKIKPLAGSNEMPDWRDKTENIMKDFLSDFEESVLPLPADGYTDVMNFVQSEASGNLFIESNGNSLILCGNADVVSTMAATVNDMIRDIIEEVPEYKQYAKKYVKYLEKFSKHEVEKIRPPMEYEFDSSSGLVTVTATKKMRTHFWCVIENEIKGIEEKILELEQDVFELLKSERGVSLIENAIGYKLCEIVYEFEEDPPSFKLHILSPSQKKAVQKFVKHAIRKLFVSKKLPIKMDPGKFRFCNDRKWKGKVDYLQKEVLVRVTVDDSSQSVTVTGEEIVVDDVISKLQSFLLEQTYVEEQVSIGYHQWYVIDRDMSQELAAVNAEVGKDMIIHRPKPTEVTEEVSVIIRGEPDVVDDVRSKLEGLAKKVCFKEETLRHIPAASKVLESMKDKLYVLQNQYGASIDANVIDDHLGADQNQAGLAASRVCSATCSNGVRISVYNGDFTKHSHVDAMVVFIPPNPQHLEDSNLKMLFSTGGWDIESDFWAKISELLHQVHCDVFQSNPGKLKCARLFHCILPPWGSTSRNEKEKFYLVDCLQNFLSTASTYNTIIFTSVCSSPLKYPADIFAKSVLSLVGSSSNLSYDLTVVVYVNDVAHAREFEVQFKENNCEVAPPPVSAPKAITRPASSFLTLTKGDILKQTADVYICATSTTLGLETGSLSSILLKQCGEELQKECSELAPLETEKVIGVDVKNVNAKKIYFIHLPNYNEDPTKATKNFRETVKVILQRAKQDGVKSIAFPSLGEGNPRYPPQISAKILFEEVTAFHTENPGTDMKFHFVIFKQSAYQEFSKEYAQIKSNVLPQTRGLLGNRGTTGSTQLTIENADVAEEETDIIVNTTTKDMQLHGSPASNALLKKAGSVLQQTCDQLMKQGQNLDQGNIVDTEGFRSKCKRIFHAHVPSRSETKRLTIDHYSLIAQIVMKCLRKAENLGMTSISFPAFGYGRGGYQVHEVAEPMLSAFKEFGSEGPKKLQVIKVVILDKKLHKEFFDFYVNFFKIDMTTPRKVVSAIKSTLTWSPKSSHGAWYVELQSQEQLQVAALQRSYASPLQNKLVHFKIYASTEKKCAIIATELRDIMMGRCVTEEIENPLVSSLIDADITDIESIGNKLQVKVTVTPQIQQIKIQGETTIVREAIMEIREVMKEVEQAQNELKLFQWQSETESGDDTEPYTDVDSVKLERARAKKVSKLQMMVDNIPVVVDLAKMEEVNTETGNKRKVMRVHKTPSLNPPITWEPQPPKAESGASDMYMFEVDKSSPEYKEALEGFFKTIKDKVTVKSLKRVQNPVLYRKHIALQDSLCEKYRKKKIHTLQLFHGSKEETMEQISTQGFNRILAAEANAARFGDGVYFALNSNYSAKPQYAVPNKDGHQSMFICRVIIGEYTVGTGGMKKPPTLGKDTNEVFDTLVNDKDTPVIFVTTADAQAYPDYLVIFKKEK